MITKIKENFKSNPTLYYALSICATWANAGSLLNGVTISTKNGIIPYLLWAVGNTLACIVFGIFAPMIPKLRDVFRSKPVKIIMGIMCPFQCWISMNGIQQVFSDTVIGSTWGIVIALAIAVFFIFLLIKYGMIRNVLTDHVSWIMVYALVFAVSVIAFAKSGATIPAMGLENTASGIKNALLLIPGAFLYPYYFSLLDYNEKNEDGTKSVNIRKAFILGGLTFGIYLVFIFIMSLTTFGPVLNIVKAVLVTLIAASSLSSFLYSIYIIFGRKLGLGINVLTIGLWQFLIPLGVMGAWTLMASIRIYIVAGCILFAIGWYIAEKRHLLKKGGERIEGS